MKKLLSILSLLVIVALFTGCSLLPTASPVKKTTTPPAQIADLINYEGKEYHQGEVLIRTIPGMDLTKWAEKRGVQVKESWDKIGWSLITVPEGKDELAYIKELKTEKGILFAEPNFKHTLDAIPAAVQYTQQWGFQNINAETGWDTTTGSSNVIIAIIDSGVDMTHYEFVDKTFFQPYNAITGTSDVVDWDGHGTHVAGIAADNGRTGYTAGVAWDCPIMPVRVLDDMYEIKTSYLISAMEYVGAIAASYPEYRFVANMSIGGRGYSFAFKDAMDYVTDMGVLLITAAGNDGKRIPNYPSAYNGVVSVAASTPWDVKAEFSTMGFWNSVAAPGVDILSTVPGNGYAISSGTSMAAPFVTGAAALLLSQNPGLTPMELKNQIEQTANGAGFSEELGHGILDIQAMLGTIQPMTYGTLNVITDITDAGDLGMGMITVVDEYNNLVAYGTTGQYGNHRFSALKEDVYKVTVSYFNKYTNAYHLVENTVGVSANGYSETIVDIAPTVTVTSVLSTVIDETAYSTITIPITLVQDGIYTFETRFYTTEVDTVIRIYDSLGQPVAYNDDNGIDRYSYIMETLPAGSYTIEVSNITSLPPVNCYLDVFYHNVTN